MHLPARAGVSTSRSLDGSSSSNTLPPLNKVFAKCKRPRSPPESCPAILLWSLPLKLKRPKYWRAGISNCPTCKMSRPSAMLSNTVLSFLQTFAALVNQAHFHGLPDFHFAGIRLLFARNHFEQRRFTRAVRTNDADNRTRRHFEAQIVNQHFIAK